LILLALIPSILISPPIMGLMPVFAKDELGVGPKGLGLLLAVFGAGGLIGPILLATLGNVRRQGLLLLGAGALSGLGLVAFSQTNSVALALPFLVVVGAAQMFYYTTNNAVLQAITPDALRGRVMSLYSVDHGLVPLGSLMAGLLAYAYGSPLAILAGGAAGAGLILLAGTWSKAIRSLP
jgi:predicted MFS family arabinose efflux permease